MSEPRTSRRRFLVTAAVAATALPLGARLLTGEFARAQELPRLPLDNPQAKALNYVETTEGLSHPSFKPDSSCANCQFFQATNNACQLFPGFSVEPAGWCSAWAKKA